MHFQRVNVMTANLKLGVKNHTCGRAFELSSARRGVGGALGMGGCPSCPHEGEG